MSLGPSCCLFVGVQLDLPIHQNIKTIAVGIGLGLRLQGLRGSYRRSSPATSTRVFS